MIITEPDEQWIITEHDQQWIITEHDKQLIITGPDKQWIITEPDDQLIVTEPMSQTNLLKLDRVDTESQKLREMSPAVTVDRKANDKEGRPDAGGS